MLADRIQIAAAPSRLLPMSANKPKDELPPGMVAGEYVQLDVEAFLKAYAALLHVMAGKLPCADGFTPGLRSSKGCPPSSLRTRHSIAACTPPPACSPMPPVGRVSCGGPSSSRASPGTGSTASTVTMMPDRCTSR